MGLALDLIISLGGKIYSVTRSSPGSYSSSQVSGGGLFLPGGVSVINVTALIQPITDREAALLPEGARQRQGFVVWTEDPLFVDKEMGLERADVITIDGEKHSVVKVQKWGGDIPHYRSIVLRNEEQT